MSVREPDKRFDPAARAAEKAALRREDLRMLEAGETSRAELAKRNAFFGALDIRKARILNRPEIEVEISSQSDDRPFAHSGYGYLVHRRASFH